MTVDLVQLDLAEGHQRVEQRDRRLLRRERRLGLRPPPELPVEVLQRVRRAAWPGNDSILCADRGEQA